MADVSDFCAPTSMSENSSQNDSNSSQNDCSRQAGAGKNCSGCGEPTKGHLGPYGATKCIAGAMRRLVTRVDKLEKDRDEKDECIRQLETLATKRQEGLLATICTCICICICTCICTSATSTACAGGFLAHP